jgi:acylphosphatase
MVALCRHGPPTARVDNVTDEPANADALNLRRSGERFSVLPTV